MTTMTDNVERQPRRNKMAHLSLFDVYDQGRVRADLATFFGPNADTYLATYEKMRAAEPNRRTSVRTWSWPVFLGSFTWFFYRKMYTSGAIVIFVPLVLGYLFSYAGGGASIIFTISAKNWYVSHALSRIYKADQLGLTGPERTEYLQRAGGVSLAAGIFAGLIYGLALIAVTLGLLAHHKTGQP